MSISTVCLLSAMGGAVAAFVFWASAGPQTKAVGAWSWSQELVPHLEELVYC